MPYIRNVGQKPWRATRVEEAHQLLGATLVGTDLSHRRARLPGYQFVGEGCELTGGFPFVAAKSDNAVAGKGYPLMILGAFVTDTALRSAGGLVIDTRISSSKRHRTNDMVPYDGSLDPELPLSHCHWHEAQALDTLDAQHLQRRAYYVVIGTYVVVIQGLLDRDSMPQLEGWQASLHPSCQVPDYPTSVSSG
ncbi:hypothetical protein OE88DRAFT_729241 [Heliocybe sulcata]|uniref:Uncharacterized protein n=1 Tax=Heliocybe sulcata TaxID=5364 RepID=A0A5C3NII4_9AGAM|nr:hypothetical protein OE88DRAFT_729241 [Heliocybe sulcata]